ncbi:MAG: ATP phosphoribosyltransferase regulatory subunit, partial [Clostridium paraputrificum]
MVNKNIIPEGTRDLILDECIRKKELELEIENILNKWGYKEVITPTIEYYQTFNGGFQNLKEEDMYKFFDDKGRILVLRPDMTIPIARVVATKFKEINPPIRLRYNSNVFRVHESLGGKKNEYTDCGVELIGLNGIDSDVEILITALESLKVLKETGYKIEVGNINFFDSAVEWLNLDFGQRSILAKLIDEKSMKELEEYLDMLKVGDDYKDFFMKLPWLFGGVEVLDIGEKYAINNEILNEIKYLRNIYEILDSLG